MAVMRNDSGWYSTILEKTFDSEQAARHYELRELQSRTRRTPEQEEAENLKPEVIRALYDNEMVSHARKEAFISCEQDVFAFHEMHPEYIDSDANSAQMCHYFTSRGIESPSLEQLESAYESLRDAGLIGLNRAEVAKQQKQKVRQRVEKIVKRRASEPTLEEMEAMPLNELAARARNGA